MWQQTPVLNLTSIQFYGHPITLPLPCFFPSHFLRLLLLQQPQTHRKIEMAASPSLLTPKLKPALAAGRASSGESRQLQHWSGRRGYLILGSAGVVSSLLLPFTCSPPAALAASEDEEYVKETEEVINKVRRTINMDRSDPDVASAVAELRDVSNSWVAKYRREKALLGRPSFRDIYSALNAVSGHYISFGPTAPIPAKRKARILEEMDTAEKALLRGR